MKKVISITLIISILLTLNISVFAQENTNTHDVRINDKELKKIILSKYLYDSNNEDKVFESRSTHTMKKNNKVNLAEQTKMEVVEQKIDQVTVYDTNGKKIKTYKEEDALNYLMEEERQNISKINYKSI